MDDRQIVDGARRGDRDAVAALYDRYADVLHDFARRRVLSRADAFDVVHDTLLVAVERIEQLRDPERLRPWLYAIARTELHRRYRQAARYVELDTDDEWRQPVSQEPGPDAQAEHAELVALLRQATAGLTDSDRELLDLHMRHGLVGADLAAAAGIPARHASVALERVKARLGRTLGVVLLSRQPTCEEFAAIQDAQPEGLTPLTRKRLARHIDGCEVCGEEQRRRLRPEVLLGAVPILPAPPELRQRLVSSQSRLAPGGQFWDNDGFPWPLPPRDRRWPVWTLAAAAVLLLIAGTVVVTRPLITDRTAAIEVPALPTAPSRLGPTSTGGVAVPGEIVPGATTTTETTTTTTTTRTTTTTPRETAPPAIGAVTLNPAWFCADTRGRPSCKGPATATTTAQVSDPSGVSSVTMTWAGPAGSGGSATMRDDGGAYAASVGPVDGANLTCDTVYPLSVTVTAVDRLGNKAQRTVTFAGAVHRC